MKMNDAKKKVPSVVWGHSLRRKRKKVMSVVGPFCVVVDVSLSQADVRKFLRKFMKIFRRGEKERNVL